MKGIRESVARGTPDFPLTFYRHEVRHVSVVCHWHPEIEIIWVKNGSFSVSIGEDCFEAKEGSIFMVNSDELHTLYGNAGDCQFFSVVFYPELLNFESRNPFQRSCLDALHDGRLSLPHMLEEKNSAYRETWHQLCRLQMAEGGEFCRERQLVCLYELLLSLLVNGAFCTGGTAGSGGETYGALRRVTRFAEEHINEKIMLCDLAAAANMSDQYFCTFFKKYTGMKPTEYLNRMRIERACAQLAHGEDSITRVATDNGFESASYFVRRFRRQTGMSPSEYKRGYGCGNF